MRIRLDIMYDGTGFCGWQIQAGLSSIQGEITSAIKKLTGEDVSVTGSGRTDSGVHALGQVAHFDLSRDFEVEKIRSGLNFYLPPAIRIKNSQITDEDFNARFSAKFKTYFYLLYKSDTDNPLLLNRAFRVGELDISAMNNAAKLLIGSHDFAPLMSSGSVVKNTIRTITDCTVTAVADFAGSTASTSNSSSDSTLSTKNGFYKIEVTANGFLYNMVRKIAAVLISTGEGKRTAADISAIIKEGKQVKDIAPPYGLYLKNVEY